MARVTLQLLTVVPGNFEENPCDIYIISSLESNNGKIITVPGGILNLFS